MKAKEYPALLEAIEQGVQWGWSRAHKHDDSPSEESICESMREHVLNEILERFELDAEQYLGPLE